MEDLHRIENQIQILQVEIQQSRTNGVQTRKRRKEEIGKIQKNLNGKSRELWLKMQKMRRFGNLGQCKKVLTYPREETQDVSNKTIHAEAKLLLAMLQGGMIDHQAQIVQQFQKDMIEYLYTTVLPRIRDEQRMATVIGQIQLDKLMMQQQTMIRLFEECLGIRRAILLKYKLRDLANVYSRPSSPGAGINPSSTTTTTSTKLSSPFSRRMSTGGGGGGDSVSSGGNYSTASRRSTRQSMTASITTTTTTTSNSEPQSPQRPPITSRLLLGNGSPRNSGSSTTTTRTSISPKPGRRMVEKSDLLERARSARVAIMEKSKIRDSNNMNNNGKGGGVFPGRPPVSPGIVMNDGNHSTFSPMGVKGFLSRRSTTTTTITTTTTAGGGDDTSLSAHGVQSLSSPRRLLYGGSEQKQQSQYHNSASSITVRSLPSMRMVRMVGKDPEPTGGGGGKGNKSGPDKDDDEEVDILTTPRSIDPSEISRSSTTLTERARQDLLEKTKIPYLDSSLEDLMGNGSCKDFDVDPPPPTLRVEGRTRTRRSSSPSASTSSSSPRDPSGGCLNDNQQNSDPSLPKQRSPGGRFRRNGEADLKSPAACGSVGNGSGGNGTKKLSIGHSRQKVDVSSPGVSSSRGRRHLTSPVTPTEKKDRLEPLLIRRRIHEMSSSHQSLSSSVSSDIQKGVN